ncbi:MAG: DUF1800 domain-containing protein [Ignavibacteriae bacterium]|nr:DUF1800 domain-containing protein [Ignavibacteriota bacterium]
MNAERDTFAAQGGDDLERLDAALRSRTRTPLARPGAFVASARGLRTTAGLEPYTGPWDTRHAEHLLRRTTFAPTRELIAQAAGMTLDAAVTALFAQQPAPPDPYGYGPSDPADQTSTRRIWAWSEYTAQIDFYYRNGLRTWWFDLMYTQGFSLREKMVLFWHNHFVSEFSVVNNTKLIHAQNMLLRNNAFGNFKKLARDITIDPAMLIYLNGTDNTKTKPNENYARELQELFTIGKGPEIAAGNYTFYTEHDVQQAARVLTGWRVNRLTGSSSFSSSLHDTGDKTFSSAYQNTIIKGETGGDGAKELDALLDMIFAQNETARFICRKLYRYFVYYDISAEIETNVIEPMAALLRSSNWDVRPVLEALLKSAHFHSDAALGCAIKHPVDFIIGALRQHDITLVTPAQDQLQALNVRASLLVASSMLQMDIFDPPSVAGWPAYYQVPQFAELWINSATLPYRGGFSDSLIDSFRAGGIRIQADVIALAKRVSDPSDPRVLISETSDFLYALQLTSKQKEFILTDVLLPGLPDYEWTVEWNDYIADPTNTAKRLAVQSKLAALYKFLLRLAEYQLM